MISRYLSVVVPFRVHRLGLSSYCCCCLQCLAPKVIVSQSSGIPTIEAFFRSTLAFSTPASSKALTINSTSALRSLPYPNFIPAGVTMPACQTPIVMSIIPLSIVADIWFPRSEISVSLKLPKKTILWPFSDWIRSLIKAVCLPEIERGVAYSSASRAFRTALSAAVPAASADALARSAALAAPRAEVLASSASLVSSDIRSSLAFLMSVSTFPAWTSMYNSPATPTATRPAPSNPKTSNNKLGFSGGCTIPRRKSCKSSAYSQTTNTTSSTTPTTTRNVQKCSQWWSEDCDLSRLSSSVLRADSSIKELRDDQVHHYRTVW